MSRITLALLQDTGWYEVNFDNAEQLKWGRLQGCEFALVCIPNHVIMEKEHSS